MTAYTVQCLGQELWNSLSTSKKKKHPTNTVRLRQTQNTLSHPRMHKAFCLSLCPWLMTMSDSARLNETDVMWLVVMRSQCSLASPCRPFYSRLAHLVNLLHVWLLESLWDTRANRGSRTATVILLVLEHSGMSCWKHPPPDGSLTSAAGIRESYYHIHVEIIRINTAARNSL